MATFKFFPRERLNQLYTTHTNIFSGLTLPNQSPDILVPYMNGNDLFWLQSNPTELVEHLSPSILFQDLILMIPDVTV